MHLKHYPIETSSDGFVYQFESVGSRGVFKKVVVFTPTDEPDVYNLGLGDLSPDGTGIDDQAVTDNGDTQQVLATVARIVLKFTARYPHFAVYATGNTPARTRLYRRGIATNIEWMRDLFDIEGFTDGAVYPFEAGIEYEAFIARRKS